MIFYILTPFQITATTVDLETLEDYSKVYGHWTNDELLEFIEPIAEDKAEGLKYVGGAIAKKCKKIDNTLGYRKSKFLPSSQLRASSWFIDGMNRGGLLYPTVAFYSDLKVMNERFERYHPYKRLTKSPNVIANFAKSLIPYFPSYDYQILYMFAKMRTAIRIREWNHEIDRLKKMTLRGQTKTAEYMHGNQGEGRALRSRTAQCIPDEGKDLRTRAAECFPDEDFGDQMSDQELLKFLESDDLETIPEEQEENLEMLGDSGFPEPIAGPSWVDCPQKVSRKKRAAREQPAGCKQPARKAKKSQKNLKSPEAHQCLPETIENLPQEIDPSKEMEVSHDSDWSDLDHELEGEFKCDLCTETFFSEFNLMTHVELKHDEDQEMLELVDQFPEPIAGPSRVDLPPKKSSKKRPGEQPVSRKQPARRAKKSQ